MSVHFNSWYQYTEGIKLYEQYIYFGFYVKDTFQNYRQYL